MLKSLLLVCQMSYGEDEDASIFDSEGFIYTDADHAKDWNYFKNTMLV